MRNKLLGIIFILFIQITFGQKKKYAIHSVAFYNLENLFDTINNPDTNDEASPMMEIKSNRSEIYFKKIKNLQKVIAEIGYEKTRALPTILGVAEIENETVLDDLMSSNQTLEKNYNYIHYDSPDKRGIDVALLYNKNKFIPMNHHSYELKLWSDKGYRIYTRDQLLVSGYLENELIHIIVNHWPSRRGGEKKSRILREKAAFLNKKISDSIFTKHPHSKIILMGDLNDNPTNSSLKKILKTEEISKQKNDTIFYNPYETLYKKGFGTLGYRDQVHLFDQILINGKFISTKFNELSFYQSHIFNPSYLTQQNGKYKGYPFRSFGNGSFTDGFSDHYPVYIYLIKELD
ncbi:endonuclease/exonuclease/phosphatase family protein [Flavicella sp.]|uniref:endonuclease/exonuclease/phosphatase family protein n=1 Tax=Flavicella sp. TaxID=2957742 RepID=UPI0026146039|nr:endonuclease/exonuclease/phosphatase family protein [Flavicella sp.]MDG1805450.1 endonuclease/exonuclease/phosphatase family protein [Flavicella sp.]